LANSIRQLDQPFIIDDRWLTMDNS
jgi:hypothetical protein